MAVFFGGFCLTDQLLDLFDRDILLLHKHGNDRCVGLVEIFAYHVFEGILAKLLPGDGGEVAVGIAELLMIQKTLLLQSADNRGDGVVVRFGFGQFVDDLFDVGGAFLPEELHDLFFAIGEMLHCYT